MGRVLCGCMTQSPLHFTDIHRCIPPCSVSVTFASEESLWAWGLRRWAALLLCARVDGLPVPSPEGPHSCGLRLLFPVWLLQGHRGFVRVAPALLSTPLPIPCRSPVFMAEDLSLDGFAVACSSPCPFPSLGLPILFIG